MARRRFVKTDIAGVLKSFANRTYDQCGSFNYAAGVYESMLATVIADLPRHKQVECLALLQSANYSTQADQRVI
jgi:hypothetical protein